MFAPYLERVLIYVKVRLVLSYVDLHSQLIYKPHFIQIMLKRFFK